MRSLSRCIFGSWPWFNNPSAHGLNREKRQGTRKKGPVRRGSRSRHSKARELLSGGTPPGRLFVDMSPTDDHIVIQLDPSKPANIQILNGTALLTEVPRSSFSFIFVVGDPEQAASETVAVNGNPAPVTLEIDDAANAHPTIYTITNTSVSATIVPSGIPSWT